MKLAEHTSVQPHMLSLIATFTAALAHELRSPLSVIQNEISYFETILCKEDFSRAKRNCQRLAQTLATAVIPQPIEIRLHMLAELQPRIPEIDWQTPTASEQYFLLIDIGILRFTLRTLKSLLSTDEHEIKFEASHNSRTLCIATAGLHASLPGLYQESLTTYLHSNVNSPGSPIPALLELLIRAQAGKLSVGQYKNRVACLLELGLTHA